jgi:hypothetical protein
VKFQVVLPTVKVVPVPVSCVAEGKHVGRYGTLVVFEKRLRPDFVLGRTFAGIISLSSEKLKHCSAVRLQDFAIVRVGPLGTGHPPKVGIGIF